MVQVVEFGDRAVSRLEHLHEDQSGDGFDVIGGQLVEKPVHQAPPAPEAVARIGAPGFGQARHGPLKGMAVQVERRRQQQRGPVGRLARGRADLFDSTIRANRHLEIGLPAARRKGLFCMDDLHANNSIDIFM